MCHKTLLTITLANLPASKRCVNYTMEWLTILWSKPINSIKFQLFLIRLQIVQLFSYNLLMKPRSIRNQTIWWSGRSEKQNNEMVSKWNTTCELFLRNKTISPGESCDFVLLHACAPWLYMYTEDHTVFISYEWHTECQTNIQIHTWCSTSIAVSYADFFC